MLEGAPNFRHIGLSEIPIYGTAIPTIQGIFTILKIVGKDCVYYYYIFINSIGLIYVKNH